MNLMKILYLHQYFKKPDENGGTRSYDLSMAFIKNGFSVEVVTTTSNPRGFDGAKWRIEMVDGMKVHYLFLPYDNSFSFVKRALTFILFLWYSLVKLLKLKGDVVLATSTPLTIAIPAMLKRLFSGTPYIFEVRDVWPEAVIAIGAIRNKWIQSLLYSLEYYAYKYARFIVPLSIDMQKSIITRYPKFRDKCQTVIENIAEIDRFSDLGNGSSQLADAVGFVPKKSILYAGTFGKVNGIKYVLQLAKKVLNIDDSIIFLLMGTGAEKGALMKDANLLQILNRNVFFLNPISKKDLPSIYNIVTMGSSFVAPIEELWANSANKFFDTLAAGKPILINHRGWQAETIERNKIGYVLDSNIEKVDVDNFVSFLNDEANLREFGTNAKREASKNYSLEVASCKYIKLLKDV